MEGVGGWRVKDGERKNTCEGGVSRPQSLHGRPGLHLRFTHSAEMSLFAANWMKCRLCWLHTEEQL